jgi:hypothetical protein
MGKHLLCGGVCTKQAWCKWGVCVYVRHLQTGEKQHRHSGGAALSQQLWCGGVGTRQAWWPGSQQHKQHGDRVARRAIE